ncbi:MAG: molecular chaperone DnaK [Bdellovibrionales bacterium CG10_big_fil_rev_8_21_14_0_10_45_34]|nr:MAG: molecular chaperone DnaK [Bdellovibrionales bacterium CG10_big_fil_rev_8_21_14_0_10_45_34]
MTKIPIEVIKFCKIKLLETKEDLLNRVKDVRTQLLDVQDAGGDEGDQSVRMIEEGELMAHQERLRSMLFEVEIALSKIERGSYGVCEETEEPIEPERLKAIPWTRLSIEGAEVREALQRRYAR